MAAPKCRNCGGLAWRESDDVDEHGRCVDCREFPTLGWGVAALVQSVCAIPDGQRMGEPYLLTDDQFRIYLHHYRLNPFLGRFTHFRGSQVTRPQKWGKGPLAASFICGEAHPESPVLFDGWDADGQPVGRPWATPHIQVTAVSEDQTDNVFRALLPMIRLGDLGAEIPDTGITRINLPSGGLIEPVTAAALSRLGQRVTFVVQDQTESWFRTNGGHKLADNQRRGLAGMGGRFLSTPNAWDPAEDSVAQRAAESKAPGVYHDDVDPGAGSVRNKAERRRMLRKVYGDAASKPRPDAEWEPWIDLDRIDGEIQALLEHDPAQAERWFLNRKLAGESAAFDIETFKLLGEPMDVPDGSLVVGGVDGARFRDALAMIGAHVETGYQWPLGIWERPPDASPSYEHPQDEADAVMIEFFRRFNPWRVYVDPQYIEHLLEKWQGRWGEKRVVPWFTNKDRPIAWAVRNYTIAIGAADFRHSGDERLVEHHRNARKRPLNVYDDRGQQMHTIAKDRHDSPRKMDAAIASVIARECRGDAIAAGAVERSRQRPLAHFL
jgi:hypothetical protein